MDLSDIIEGTIWSLIAIETISIVLLGKAYAKLKKSDKERRQLLFDKRICWECGGAIEEKKSSRIGDVYFLEKMNGTCTEEHDLISCMKYSCKECKRYFGYKDLSNVEPPLEGSTIVYLKDKRLNDN